MIQTTKKRPYPPLIIAGAILTIIAGYYVNGAWKPGMEFAGFLESFNKVCSNPLRDYYNEYTLKAVVIALVIYAMMIVIYYTSQHELMPGKEYGTAKFITPKQLNFTLMEKKNPDNNRIFSQNVRMSINTGITRLNNNVVIIGASGTGKTFTELKPNMSQMNSSFIITDPKSEILRSMGGMLEKNGYDVKVINLIDMEHSHHYNPFNYIREEKDIVRLITNLMANTTPKDSGAKDPFWDHAEGMFLQSIFFYVWMEMPPVKRNMRSVMELLSEAKVPGKDEKSDLDVRMAILAEVSPLGEKHPAIRQYNKCMRGAGDTIRSIIISANSRLAKLENEQVLELLSKDDMNIADIGNGKHGDGKTKTALFCVIPDSDKSYNFIIGMLYTQIFQELYYQADEVHDGPLPIHVTFMLDEFANVALPDDFTSLISTMRGRNISSIIIIQNLVQLKVLFKDSWESVTGNCDTTIYLGGNEQSTHEYVSKLLGKTTIEKRSTGLSRGRQGSSSQNYDVIQRDLMTPDEVRMLDNSKCIVIVRGLNPVIDDKFHPKEHPRYLEWGDGGGDTYQFVPALPDGKLDEGYEIVSAQKMKEYMSMKEKGKPVYVNEMSYDEFMMLGDLELKQKLMEQDEADKKKELIEHEDIPSELQYTPDEETEKSIVSELIAMKKKELADKTAS